MTHNLNLSESAIAQGAFIRRCLAVALWNGRANRKTAKAVERICGHVCHRIENPRFRKLPENGDSAKKRRGVIGENGKLKRSRKPGAFVIEDKQRLGFKEIRLSEWDKQEIRGAVSLVSAGIIPDGRDGEGNPEYTRRAALWNRALGLDDWKALFRTARAALRMDCQDGPGARSKTVSMNALEDLAKTDFHSGLAAGKSGCDLESSYSITATELIDAREAEANARAETETKNRVRFADLARDFRRALVCARDSSAKSRKAARREWLANLKTLRLATRAISGAGHGMNQKRKDGKSSRSLHARIARFSAYLAQGFLAEACEEFAGDIRKAFEASIRITLTATANC